jgi:hypothetical protein
MALFSVKVNGTNNPVSVALDPLNDKKIIVKLTNPVIEGQMISLSLKQGILTNLGSPLAPMSDLSVMNSVVNLYGSPLNGSFEESTGGFPTGFKTWNGSAINDANYTLDTDAKDGAKSLKISLNNDGKKWSIEDSNFATLEAGAQYEMTIWAKTTGANVSLDFRAVAQGWAYANGKNATLTSTWKPYSFTFTAPTGTNPVLKVKYWQEILSNTTAAVFVDKVTLYRID